ncbi:hypothetical protein GCM10009702_10760 [Propioniferax innocua]
MVTSGVSAAAGAEVPKAAANNMNGPMTRARRLRTTTPDASGGFTADASEPFGGEEYQSGEMLVTTWVTAKT